MRVAGWHHLFGDLAVGMNRQHAIGKHEVARLQSARKSPDDAGADHQLGIGYHFERASCGFCRALMTDTVANNRELFASDFCAEALQAVECQRSVLAQAALEGCDLAREGVKEKYQPLEPISVCQRPA